MNVVELEAVGKTFHIPDDRKDTVRDRALSLFRPRPYRTLHALDNVTLAIPRGDSFGIMGHNGSGKSTLLKIISGIYEADSGKVTVRAPITPILELGVGWDPELDAIDNVLLVGVVMGMSLAQVRSALDEILAFSGVGEFAHLPLKHYSSGMAARLAYSVAFSAVQEVLILDEVLAVGDAGFKRRCEERFVELDRTGHTTILVSHNALHVRNFCRHAALFDHGRIVKVGSGDEIADAYLAAMQSG